MTWEEHAATWEEREAVRAYAREAYAGLERVRAARSLDWRGGRALDFGCGTGLLTERLANDCAEVVAVDTSRAMLDRLRQKIAARGLDNVVVDDRPLADAALRGPFDLIVASSVCAFLDDYPGAARQLCGLLRPGGLWVQWDWEVDPAADDPFGLSRAAIREALAGAGLVAIEVREAFALSVDGATMRPLIGVGQAPR